LEELHPSELWTCPFACGKQYRNTSTISIRRHRAACEELKAKSDAAGLDGSVPLPPASITPGPLTAAAPVASTSPKLGARRVKSKEEVQRRSRSRSPRPQRRSSAWKERDELLKLEGSPGREKSSPRRRSESPVTLRLFEQ
jgi:hypothetical protein